MKKPPTFVRFSGGITAKDVEITGNTVVGLVFFSAPLVIYKHRTTCFSLDL